MQVVDLHSSQNSVVPREAPAQAYGRSYHVQKLSLEIHEDDCTRTGMAED